MLGKNPIDITRKEPLSREEMIQAIRWAIMAELDAVNFYTQFAQLIQDEGVKKVFLDIAKEEKEHIGEFLELLRRLDPEQVEAIKHGSKEVEELIGPK